MATETQEASEATALVQRLATHGLANLEGAADAINDHVREQLDDFGRVDDEVIKILRKGIEANLEEIGSLMRSDIDVRARITPVGALAYAMMMRREGVGLRTLERSYHIALVFFRTFAEANLHAASDDEETAEEALEQVDAFLWKYVGGLVERLADAYQTEEPRELPAPDSELFTEGPTHEAAKSVVEEMGTMDEADEEQDAETARERAVFALLNFEQLIQLAADDEDMGRKLANADTDVVIALADEGEVALTLYLREAPVETERGRDEDAESTIHIASVDLRRLWSKEFQLPMAIARGRIRAEGPVRKFLRILPLLRDLAAKRRAAGDEGALEAAQTSPDVETRTFPELARRDPRQQADSDGDPGATSE